MNRKELRDELIEIKAINDFEDDDPFVACYLSDIHNVCKKYGKDEFMNGIWCCIQDLVSVYCETALANDILRSSGMSVEQMRAAQEASGSYDEQMYQFIRDYEKSVSKNKANPK